MQFSIPSSQKLWGESLRTMWRRKNHRLLLLLSAVAKKLRQRISLVAIMMNKKTQIEMGWVVSIKKKNWMTPPKYKYVALLLQPKNTIASLLIYEQHHPVAATLTTTQWLKMHKKVSSHIFSMEIQKMRHFCNFSNTVVYHLKLIAHLYISV